MDITHTKKSLTTVRTYMQSAQGTKVGLSFQHTAAYSCIKANKACIGREYKNSCTKTSSGYMTSMSCV